MIVQSKFSPHKDHCSEYLRRCVCADFSLCRLFAGETIVFVKKNLKGSRPSEHPPVRGKNVKRCGIIGCKDKPLHGI